MRISGVQCKMARAALGWGVRDLAREAEISTQTVDRLERGDRLKDSTLGIIRATFEAANIEFIPPGRKGQGVRFKRPL